MTIKLKLSRLLGAATLALSSGFAWAEVVVVVNSAAGVDQVSASEIQQLFLGKRSDLNGVSMTPIDLSEGSESRKIFYEKVIDKDAAQLNAYWSRLIFTGKGKPPKQYFDDAEVVETILENDDAVGYIDASAVSEGVKVIYTVK